MDLDSSSFQPPSTLWQHVYLHQNMHLEQSPDMQQFAHWLLDVRSGTQLDNTGRILIPQNMICPDNSINSLITDIYPGIQHGDKDNQYFLDRSILACKNDIVMQLNSELQWLKKLPQCLHVMERHMHYSMIT